MRRSWGIMAIGAFVLIFGIFSGSYNGCFGNFAFGGETCTLWGFDVSQTVFYVVGWGLMLAGIVILVVGLIVRSGETPKATPFHPPK